MRQKWKPIMFHIMKQQTVKLNNFIDILTKQHGFSAQNIIYVHVNLNITQISKCAFAGFRLSSSTNFYT